MMVLKISIDSLKICIGSLNPAKINAVKIAFSNYFNNYEIFQIKVDSKVSSQPIGLINIIKGAINRAKSSLSYLKYEKNFKFHTFGVGIEAGLAKVPNSYSGYMDFQYCAIINEANKITLGSGIAFEYPKFVIDEILADKNKEIGEIIGKLAGNKNLKNQSGAISFLSKNRITRTEILTQAVICALLPILNEKLYYNNRNSSNF